MATATTFANSTDVVNISSAEEDYPYQQDEPPAPPRRILQGRVVTIDAIGIVLASNGDNIMPSFDDGRDELKLPAPGDLFPWAAIKQVSFVATGAEYEHAWRVQRAKESVFASANDGRLPASDAEYRASARVRKDGELQRQIREAFEASADATGERRPGRSPTQGSGQFDRAAPGPVMRRLGDRPTDRVGETGPCACSSPSSRVRRRALPAALVPRGGVDDVLDVRASGRQPRSASPLRHRSSRRSRGPRQVSRS